MGSVSDSRINRVAPLTQEQVDALNAYADSHVMYPSRFPRMGLHKIARPSVYSLHSMYKQSVRERFDLRKHLPQEYVDQAVLEYFLEFPEGTGFLDLQTYWVNQRPSMRIIAWALTGNENFWCSEKVANPKITPESSNLYGHIVASQDQVAILDANNIESWSRADHFVLQTPVRPFEVKKGEGFNMSLNLAHEVRASSKRQLWFCLGLMMDSNDTGLNRNF